MTVRQRIAYKAPHRYFGGFLQWLIDTSGVLANVEQNKEEIVLTIDAKNSNLAHFNTLLNRFLPHSLFLGEITTEQTNEPIVTQRFESFDYPIAPCAKCIESLSDPSSEHYLDERLVCNHYSNPALINYEDCTIFSPHYSPDATLLLTHAAKVRELFNVTTEEINALFSIEKPTLKVTLADRTLQEMSGKKFIKIKAPYNNKSLLASINAKESGMDYLFFHPTQDREAVVVQKNISLITNPYETLELLDEDRIINRFVAIQKEAQFQNAIGCYLSTQGVCFLVANEMATKRVITFAPFSMAKVWERFQSDAKRSTLLANYTQKYPHTIDILRSSIEDDLFEAVAVLLELNPANFEALCDSSYQFRGNGGLKIDTYFDDEGDFDYANFLGSIMSFRLAGAQKHYLAYSIFEALGDMAIGICNQLKTKFTIHHFIMMGNLFGNSVLYSRILSKFQLSNPYFSPAIALDDC
ncbi:MAG: hypothetical protein KU38_07855 [Sulfurovum sp. FS08-3]|nr:MAG: hypothetical protein KU38_07855 [Sulfurovum sp. FS08-3]